MRFFLADPTCYLIELSDIENNPPSVLDVQHWPAVTEIAAWATEYLSNPHPELGREGPVCPFVPQSMASYRFFITVQPGRDLTQADVLDTIMKYRNWFLEIEPREGPEARYKTILILFPDIPLDRVPQVIDATQISLKPEFVAKGLMLGQFHQTPPQEGGLWNPDFRPLRSPVPLLAIRHMVPTDFPFLTKDPQFVTSYLAIHGENIPRRQKDLVKEVAGRYGISLLQEKQR